MQVPWELLGCAPLWRLTQPQALPLGKMAALTVGANLGMGNVFCPLQDVLQPGARV